MGTGPRRQADTRRSCPRGASGRNSCSTGRNSNSGRASGSSPSSSNSDGETERSIRNGQASSVPDLPAAVEQTGVSGVTAGAGADSSTNNSSTTRSSEEDARSPPLSSYWFSPFSFCQRCCFCLQYLASLQGAFIGLPFAASAALLPQLLLRLFTLCGCGLLLLYDVCFGFRWVYLRLLRQWQHQWVQGQLHILFHINRKAVTEALAKERLRLLQLLAAMRQALSARRNIRLPSAAPAVAADSKEKPFPPAAAAAARAALKGDWKGAAALYGVRPETAAAALDAARQQLAELASRGGPSKQQRQPARAALTAAIAAAAVWTWKAAKAAARLACCVLLVLLFIEVPSRKVATEAARAGWNDRYPRLRWQLALLHSAARALLVAAAMNLHVASYLGATDVPSPEYFCTRSRSNKEGSRAGSATCGGGAGCVLEKPPKRWRWPLRLFCAFLIPVLCSIGVAAGSGAAAQGNPWEIVDLLRLPLAMMHFALQLLPGDVSLLFPLQQQRSAAAERLLVLLQQQKALGWLRWPEENEDTNVLLFGALVTSVAALASRCSRPPPLWHAHIILEQEAAAAAVRQLLSSRTLQLQQQPLWRRVRSRCRWLWEYFMLLVETAHIRAGRTLRIVGVVVFGMLWLVLLLAAFSTTPVLQVDGGTWQTPLQVLEDRLPWAEVQVLWAELRHLQADLKKRTKRGGYREAFAWLRQQLEDAWNHQLEEERSRTEGYMKALAIFGLKEDATAAEIRQRYRQLAKQHHPDIAAAGNRGGAKLQSVRALACREPDTSSDCSRSQEFMQNINIAYEVLLRQAGVKPAGWK